MGRSEESAKPLTQKKISNIAAFLQGETMAGLILMGAAAVALIVANSPGGLAYAAFLDTPLLGKSPLHWINDGFMAVFFLLVGLEIKREFVGGELSTRAKAALPLLAAAGGMAGPALIYLAINWSHPAYHNGWAIPSATDIAFALGVMALLGHRVPRSLKIFLTALAVIDDLGAILIIALFYTADLSAFALGIAAACVAIMFALNRLNVRKTPIYLAIGVVLWLAVLQSGVHATMAGVITALMIPADEDDDGTSSLTRLEHALHPYATYFILPVFALANAGISFAGITWEALSHPITLGIVAGLFLGKQLGVLAISYTARALGWVRLPADASPFQFYGTAVLTGIGFTMSLFIGNLAFATPENLAQVKVGVLAGSLLSGIAGYLLLRRASP